MSKSHEMIQLIVHSADAKRSFLKAIRSARAGEWKKINDLIQHAHESLNKAKTVNDSLYHEEKQNNKVETTFLMVYAQGQIMNAITVQEIALEMIENMKKVYKQEEIMQSLKSELNKFKSKEFMHNDRNPISLG